MDHIILAEISEVDVLRDPDRALAHAYIESCLTYFVETEQKHDRLPADCPLPGDKTYLSELSIREDADSLMFVIQFTKE